MRIDLLTSESDENGAEYEEAIFAAGTFFQSYVHLTIYNLTSKINNYSVYY